MKVLVTAKIGEEEITWPIYTKVAGVTGKNEDRKRRQDILATLGVGEELILMRDDYNEHDENAIEVLTMDFEQIGYIKKGLAAKLAPVMDEGQELYCEVENITGGEEGKETLGCNIRIKLGDFVPKQIPGTITTNTDQPTEVSETVPPKRRKGFFLVIWSIIKWTVIVFLSLFGIFAIVSFIVYG